MEGESVHRFIEDHINRAMSGDEKVQTGAEKVAQVQRGAEKKVPGKRLAAKKHTGAELKDDQSTVTVMSKGRNKTCKGAGMSEDEKTGETQKVRGKTGAKKKVPGKRLAAMKRAGDELEDDQPTVSVTRKRRNHTVKNAGMSGEDIRCPVKKATTRKLRGKKNKVQ